MRLRDPAEESGSLYGLSTGVRDGLLRPTMVLYYLLCFQHEIKCFAEDSLVGG